jgi:Holliday junction resolvasome RuvABC endonuclease subunit
MTSKLADAVRALPGKLGRAPAPWEPPEVTDFMGALEVLAFDPSLSAAGWVGLIRRRREIEILGHGTLRPRTELKGYRATYDKASQLRMMATALFQDEFPKTTPNFRIAWEAPPVRGQRTESTLIAGWICYDLLQEGTPVQASHASKVLAGNPRHHKEEIRLAVARYVPEVLNRSWDQHQRDALAVGLTVLYDELAARRAVTGGAELAS